MSKSKSMCKGCENDFYNDKNLMNIKECWCYKKAKIVLRKEVPNTLAPPWEMEPEHFLSCYQRKGFAYHDPSEIC